MSGIALTTIAAIVALIPGLVFVVKYYSVLGASSLTGNIELGYIKALVIAVTVSLPVHWAWGMWIDDLGVTYGVSFDGAYTFFRVLQGVEVKDTDFDRHLTHSYFGLLSLYVVTQAMAAYVVAWVLAKLLDKFGWTLLGALRGPTAYWTRLLAFTGYKRQPDLIFVTVVRHLEGYGWLYYGILKGYELDASGSLKYLTLEGASKEWIGREGDTDGDSIDTGGESFVLDCRGTESVAIDYWYNPHVHLSWPRRFWLAVRYPLETFKNRMEVLATKVSGLFTALRNLLG